MATVDDKKIIFSMVGLNKTIQQNNKQVLKNITGYSGMDPERPMVDGTTDSSGSAINTGIDNVAYPNPRTFLFGIDFKF